MAQPYHEPKGTSRKIYGNITETSNSEVSNRVMAPDATPRALLTSGSVVRTQAFFQISLDTGAQFRTQVVHLDSQGVWGKPIFRRERLPAGGVRLIISSQKRALRAGQTSVPADVNAAQEFLVRVIGFRPEDVETKGDLSAASPSILLKDVHSDLVR